MTPDQRTALRESIGRRPLSMPLLANSELLALLDAADQRDRALWLLREVRAWGVTDLADKIDAELGATR